MINLDVVKRYYRVVTCCYSVTNELHNHSNDASYNSTFYHTCWYYEYSETFRCGITAYCYGLQTSIIGQTLWTDADQILRSAHLC